MIRIICDAAIREALHGLRRSLRLCDQAGRLLAHVLPPVEIRRDGVKHDWVSLRECGDGEAPTVVCEEALHDLAERLELCDESGNVVARILPASDGALEGSSEPQISREELDRRRASEGKTYTTAEVLAYLERI
jgi:hypothetical protein